MSEKQNIEWKIDTWGRGTLKIIKACKEAGLPEPSIIEKDGGIEVTLFSEDPSEKLRRNFAELSDKITKDSKKNIDVLANVYEAFIDFVAMETKSTSDKLRSTFGVNSKEFRSNFGDNKALLLFLIALEPKLSAVRAAERIGVSDRTIENYFSDLKEKYLDRVGSDKDGHWKIIKS